jgi:flagellin-like hook-associated protein FlgL
MGRIGASLSGIERTLLNRLAEANTAATLNSLRLATGKKINHPSDNPTTFVTLSRFQSRLSVVTATLGNVTAAAGMISQAQTALAGIRTQLGTIRTELLKDEGRSLSASERAEAQANIDTALDAIQSLVNTDINGRKLLDGSADFNITGRIASQVAGLTVYSTAAAGPVVAAEPAELTYTGDSRYAAAAATIKIVGNDGTSGGIAITTDDTLESIAVAVNAETGTTGVVATVDDNTLTFSSLQSGSDAQVQVVVEAGTFATRGGDGFGKAAGIGAAFGSTPAISGYVTEAATQAELLYTGSGSNPAADATITLTGTLGSTAISVSTAETVADVAEKINNDSHKTGVTASVETVDGDDVLTFTSVDYGTDATIAVTVGSGTFETTGGNGDGTANGTNVEAVINGHTYSGTTAAQGAEIRHREKGATFAFDADFNLTGHLGTRSYSALTTKSLDTLAAEIAAESSLTGVTATVDGNDLVLSSTITGQQARVSINVTSGTFDTVDGETSKTGSDAVQGSTSVDGNRIAVSQSGFRFEIELAAGFTGSFNPITIDGGALDFALSTDLDYLSTLAIPGLQPERLGGLSGGLYQIASGGDYSGLDEMTSRAIRIVDEALGQLTRVDGSVDGFYNAQISTSSELLDDLEEDLEDAITQTDGYNEVEETLLLTKNLDLADNALAGLAILCQQRSSIVALIQQSAGLL